MTDTQLVPAIDVHGHYGRYFREGGDPMIEPWLSASAQEVATRAAVCGVEWTIVSPLSGLFPRGNPNSVAGNEEAFRAVPEEKGLLQYVIVNPLQPATFEQARVMLKSLSCVGIKIHPEEHGYRIADEGDRLFSFFEEVAAPVMTHSGCPNSLPIDFVPFLNRFSSVRLLLAHLGNGAGDNMRADLQVRALQSAKHGNVWIDTSSARSMLPGLLEWAVREVGPDRLLFGSDTPLYHVAAQRARIDCADISVEAKRQILRENAVRFFHLHPFPSTR